MPSNHTQNYSLNQWEKSDKVLMEDFNSDNLKIDGALAAHDASLAAHAAQIARLGNCEIEFYTYTGNGGEGADHPTVFRFSKPPLFFLVFGHLSVLLASPYIPQAFCNTYFSSMVTSCQFLSWNDSKTQASFYSDTSEVTGSYLNDHVVQMNTKDRTYMVAAFYDRAKQ